MWYTRIEVLEEHTASIFGMEGRKSSNFSEALKPTHQTTRRYRHLSHVQPAACKSFQTHLTYDLLKVKVKVYKANRGIVPLIPNISDRWGWVVDPTPRPLYPRERDPVSIVQEAGWALGLVWKGAGNLASSGIGSPDRPARSSLTFFHSQKVGLGPKN